jgi:transposase
MKQYPADFRDRMLRALDAGLARVEAVRAFGVPDRTIHRLRQRRRETGSVAPLPRLGRRRAIRSGAKSAFRTQVLTHPDVTLTENCARGAATHRVVASTAAMCRAVQRLGLPLKKIPDRQRTG